MIVTGTTGTIMMTITIGIDAHPFYFAGYEKVNLSRFLYCPGYVRDIFPGIPNAGHHTGYAGFFKDNQMVAY